MYYNNLEDNERFDSVLLGQGGATAPQAWTQLFEKQAPFACSMLNWHGSLWLHCTYNVEPKPSSEYICIVWCTIFGVDEFQNVIDFYQLFKLAWSSDNPNCIQHSVLRLHGNNIFVAFDWSSPKSLNSSGICIYGSVTIFILLISLVAKFSQQEESSHGASEMGMYVVSALRMCPSIVSELV